MKKIIYFGLLLLLSLQSYAQHVTITPNGITPAMGGTYPRLSYENILALPSPQLGDLAYDLTYNCLRVYNGKWKRTNDDDDFSKVLPVTTEGKIDDDYLERIFAGKNSTYITGSFENIMNLGHVQLLSRGMFDIYIAKYHRSGVLEWAQAIGGANSDSGADIVTDSNGNLYVCGNASGAMFFNMTQSLTDTGLFLAKYSSDGVLLWVKLVGRNPLDNYSTISSLMQLDKMGNIYIAGVFKNEFDFGIRKITPRGITGIFTAKFTNEGTCLWANSGGGSEPSTLTGFTVDDNGAYITGRVKETVYFGSIVKVTSTSNTNNSIIAKINPINGEWSWVQMLNQDPINHEGSIYTSGIGTDASGNVYTIGELSGAMKIGFSIYDNRNLFMAKYDKSGNVMAFTQIPESENATFHAMVVDSNGDIYTTGSYVRDLSFGSSKLLNSNNFLQTFIAKYNKYFSPLWVKDLKGTFHNSGTDICLDYNNGIYVGGYFQDTITIGEETRTSKGEKDIYVVRIDE